MCECVVNLCEVVVHVSDCLVSICEFVVTC